MSALLLSGWTGWVLTLAVCTTVTLPYLLRRPGASAQRPVLRRLWPHYWLGYGIAALAVAHAWIAMSAGLGLRANQTGLYLATGALLLVFVQVFLGLLLREPSVRGRPAVRRRHFWVMVALVALALGHIVLNSPLLQALRQ